MSIGGVRFADNVSTTSRPLQVPEHAAEDCEKPGKPLTNGCDCQDFKEAA